MATRCSLKAKKESLGGVHAARGLVMPRKCALCGKDTGPKMYLCLKCWKIEAEIWKRRSGRFVDEEVQKGGVQEHGMGSK